MNKKLTITMLTIFVLLVGCNSNIRNNNLVVKSDNIKIPDRLEVLSPDLNKKNQDLTIKASEIIGLLDSGDSLSDEAKKDLEVKIASYAAESDKFRNQIIKIDNKEVIEIIFNKIEESTGVYDKYLNEDVLKNFDYYHVKVHYKNIDIDARNLESGYISSFYVFEDNTLVFYDKLFDGKSDPKEIKMEFDYNWFKGQVE